jgi:hypothetical protein
MTALHPGGHDYFDLVAKNDPVPCRGCTACCRGNQAVVLRPEWGDNPNLYEHVSVEHVNGRWDMTLRRRPDGDCAYLGPGGCMIYGKRPTVCRAFDCRRQLFGLSKASLDGLVERRMFSREVVEAARSRPIKVQAGRSGDPA